MGGIEIITYQQGNSLHNETFASLNIKWIEKYFEVEEADLKSLNNPVEYVIVPGGQIFFVVQDDIIHGTCALVKSSHHDNEFELVKMAVDESSKGKGYSNHLMRAAIDWGKNMGAQRITLESNRRLIPAIRLYEKFGFREVPILDSAYARCDIWMELPLTD
eukprot:gene9177-10131_t